MTGVLRTWFVFALRAGRHPDPFSPTNEGAIPRRCGVPRAVALLRLALPFYPGNAQHTARIWPRRTSTRVGLRGLAGPGSAAVSGPRGRASSAANVPFAGFDASAGAVVGKGGLAGPGSGTVSGPMGRASSAANAPFVAVVQGGLVGSGSPPPPGDTLLPRTYAAHSAHMALTHINLRRSG